jgi:hypothetical protein
MTDANVFDFGGKPIRLGDFVVARSPSKHPPACIVRALNVSVERIVTGEESR